MKRIILATLILFLSMTAPVFADSAVFYIADAAQEDACGVTGYFNVNDFGDDIGWSFFGYYPPYASYYSTYWRWAVDIPSGSVINEADVTMFSINDNADPFDAAFAALEPDGKWGNPAGFSDANYSNGTALKRIPRAGEPVLWENVPEWNLWLWYTGPDISGLVQDRIDSGAYDPAVPGESYFGLVLFHVSGDGFRGGTQEEFSDEHTAFLYVDWTPPECQSAVEICGDGIDNNCDGWIDEFCNECPVADAGADSLAHVGETVQLDGSGSADADGDMLSYSWSILSKPPGSAATISDPIAAAPTFVADVEGDYIVQLIVSDGELYSEPDTCMVVASIPRCPEERAYWKHYPYDLPAPYLDLGDVAYDADELAAILSMPVRGDASVLMARQLVTAKLNIASGSDPRPVEETIAAADALLSEYPSGVRPSTKAGKSMIELAHELESYNSGWLTLDCE